MSAYPPEELVADVAAGDGHGVGVFERGFLEIVEERAQRIIAEGEDLLVADTEFAAHGSVGVLSKFASVQAGDPAV
jgi:ABC-type nitrate/sulfonate/bicarbonate transport system substrate-binding protein